eukprot:gene31952-41448_t
MLEWWSPTGQGLFFWLHSGHTVSTVREPSAASSSSFVALHDWVDPMNKDDDEEEDDEKGDGIDPAEEDVEVGWVGEPVTTARLEECDCDEVLEEVEEGNFSDGRIDTAAGSTAEDEEEGCDKSDDVDNEEAEIPFRVGAACADNELLSADNENAEVDDDIFCLRSAEELIGAELGGCILVLSIVCIGESDIFNSYIEVSVSGSFDICVAGGEERTTLEVEGVGEVRLVGNIEADSLVWFVGVAEFKIELLVRGTFDGPVATEEDESDPVADSKEDSDMDNEVDDTFASGTEAVDSVDAVVFDTKFLFTVTAAAVGVICTGAVVLLFAGRGDVEGATPLDFLVAPDEVAEFEVATVEDVGATCAGEATASVVDDEVFCLLFLRKPTFTTPFAAELPLLLAVVSWTPVRIGGALEMGEVVDGSATTAVRAGLATLGTLFGGGAAVKFPPDNGAPPGNDADDNDNGGVVTENELNNEDTV